MALNKKWVIGSGAAAVLLAGGIYGGTALAQSAPPSPSASGKPAASAKAGFDRQGFLQHLAQRLNVSVDQLQNAFKSAAHDSVADALNAGRITQDEANIKLEGAVKASITDSKKVVEICTQYAQKGMWNIFLVVFFSTLAFACLESYFFIGYLISIALFGLYQAIFMANAGGAWDNAKKVVEVELKAKGTPLHAASVVGDTVGDPFKDTSSVAMNPIIKFTTLFGLLAVELATEMQTGTRLVLAAIFFAVSVVFVWRSFYGMRIQAGIRAAQEERATAKAA